MTTNKQRRSFYKLNSKAQIYSCVEDDSLLGTRYRRNAQSNRVLDCRSENDLDFSARGLSPLRFFDVV